MENSANALEVSPEYTRDDTAEIDSHIEALSSKVRAAGMEYFLMNTARPLDEGCASTWPCAREALDGFFTPWFLAGVVAVGLPVWLHLLKKHKTTRCRSAP